MGNKEGPRLGRFRCHDCQNLEPQRVRVDVVRYFNVPFDQPWFRV
jgi:hypothetical protein